MTKASQTFTVLGAITIVYLALVLGILPSSPVVHDQILPVLPFWALVTFGSYALGTLGYDLMTFNDKPEKYAELVEQIKEAKADLKIKGVSVE